MLDDLGGSSCPNCHLLCKLDDLRFSGPAGEDAAGKRNMQAAEIYQMYRTQLEGIESSTHWGAGDLCLLRLRQRTTSTAIEHTPSYAPVAFESKLAITVATIPGIVIFAYALGLFAGIVMNLVTHLKIESGLARRRPGVSRRAGSGRARCRSATATATASSRWTSSFAAPTTSAASSASTSATDPPVEGMRKRKKATHKKSGGRIDDEDDTEDQHGVELTGPSVRE